jgi:transcriptional regulator with XRE-family HTH domain
MTDIEYDWGNHWSRWLRQQMEQRAITRAEFVRRSPSKDNGRPEIDNTMLGRWLNGTRPTFDKAIAAADVLRMDAAEVVQQAGFIASPEDPLLIDDDTSSHLVMRMESDEEVRAVQRFLSILRDVRNDSD